MIDTSGTRKEANRASTDILREAIEAKTKEFLAKGGKVIEVDSGYGVGRPEDLDAASYNLGCKSRSNAEKSGFGGHKKTAHLGDTGGG